MAYIKTKDIEDAFLKIIQHSKDEQFITRITIDTLEKSYNFNAPFMMDEIREILKKIEGDYDYRLRCHNADTKIILMLNIEQNGWWLKRYKEK